MRKATRERARSPKAAAKKKVVSPGRIQGNYNKPAKVTSTSRRRIFVFALILAVVPIFVYLPAWNGGFIWDDDQYVTKNPLLIAPDGQYGSAQINAILVQAGVAVSHLVTQRSTLEDAFLELTNSPAPSKEYADR